MLLIGIKRGETLELLRVIERLIEYFEHLMRPTLGDRVEGIHGIQV